MDRKWDDDDDDDDNNNNNMPKEQKGCCRRSNGCKDQLIISTAILQECKRRKKNVTWHGWIASKLLTVCLPLG